MRLSAEQRAAVAGLSGPVRVVAGAGTGKTAVVAERFLRLVRAGSEPTSILVMTFTERAAGEMRSRIESGLGSWSGQLWVGTFHAMAQAFLREEGWRIGVPFNFRVLTGADRWIFLRELLWRTGDPALVGVERPDDLVAPLLRLMERFKQELVPLGRVEQWAKAAPDRELGEQLAAAVKLFRAYRKQTREEKLLDFDDLLVQVVELLHRRPEVQQRFVKRFTSILVDEYQDSNFAQERMVELLAGGGNVCVVGDDDQSIYRFRGASLASLERFARAFPGAATLTIGRNRRSSANIVAAASALIANNPRRLEKSLSAGRSPGPRIALWQCADSLAEALAIATEVKRLAAGGMPLRRIALLVRTNALARPLVAALRAARIPHQLWGVRGFYRRPEVLDAIAYLRLLDDPGAEVALARLAARPGLGLDPEEVLDRLRRARGKGEPPLAAVEASAGGAAWVSVVRQLIAAGARLGVDELFFELMNQTRYLDLASFETEADRRQAAANLGRFAELLASYCEARRDHSLRAFLAYLDLVLLSETDEEVAGSEDVEEAVQVMTIHQAKGLEFDAVFVPALVEGRLPHSRRPDRFTLPAQLVPEAPGREDQVAEERRLAYVAMTRARNRLYLTWAGRYEGGKTWQRSRFLEEIEAAGAERFQHRQVAAVPSAPLPSLAAGNAPSARTAASPEEPLQLSFSGISIYRECPRQYRFRYVYRLPRAADPEAEFGTILHLALRRLGEIRQADGGLDATALRGVHEAAWDALPLSDERRRPALKSLGLRQLERYHEAGGFAVAPALLEQAFTARIDGWQLHGIIDRVDPPAGAQGPWRLLDYKTGSPVPASRLRRDLQLALYALGARRALGLDPLELEIVYLKDATRVAAPVTEGLLGEAERIGSEVADGIRQGRFEAHPERRRCALCPYRLACSDAL